MSVLELAAAHEDSPEGVVTLPLLQGRVTLAAALDDEDNVLLLLEYSRQREELLILDL